MASKTSILFVLTFTSLVFSALGQTLNSNLRCYHCESQATKACEDMVDVSVLPVMDCSSLLEQHDPRQEDSRSVVDQVLSKPVDGKFRGAPVIEDILEGNVVQRAQKPEKLVCLRGVLSANDLKATTRTCGKVPSDVKDVCDYLAQEADPRITVHSCYHCETDKCNSASFAIVSVITVISSLFFVTIRQLF